MSAPPNCDQTYRNFIEVEQTQFLEGLLASLPENCRFFNHPDVHRTMDRKIHQLCLASRCGMRVPDTCVTSDPLEAAQFLAKHPSAIYKSFWGSEAFWQPTREVDAVVRSSLDRLRVCPAIFQENVQGPLDIRVTVVEESVVAVGFDLTKSRYPTDVRIDTKTPCQVVELPAVVESQIITFCKLAQLNYAAIDLRKTSDGEVVFLKSILRGSSSISTY